jgi:hypothetical protein
MKDTCKFDAFDSELAIQYAKDLSGKEFTNEMAIVISIAFRDLRNLPSLRFPDKDTIPLKEYMSKWVTAYLGGYNNRPSVKIGNKSNTFSDTIVKIILQARLPKVSAELASQVEGGHALMMTIENLVGDLLEEYLSVKLQENGWCCCWGSTIDAVDFCKADGSLIQIKNSDNSENSSSSRVRAGTTIEKWYRRKSTKESTYFWEDLNTKVSRKDLSEDDFRKFVQATIKNNPSCLFVDPSHSLNKI